MRGDRPAFTAHSSPVVMFTPHARGSTSTTTVPSAWKMVYPACAGIDLESNKTA